jgi:hypothetical protein
MEGMMGKAITLQRGVLAGAVVAVSVYALWRRSRVSEVQTVRAAAPMQAPPAPSVQPEPVFSGVVRADPYEPPALHGQSRRRSLTHRGRHRQLSPGGWPKQRPLARTRPAWPGATAIR